MIRRSFLKFAAAAVLVPALNWTLPHFANDRLSIAQLIAARKEAYVVWLVDYLEKCFWTCPPFEAAFGLNYWVEAPISRNLSHAP